MIASEELPPGLDGTGLVDGVWITDYRHALTLATGLREAVVTAWRYKLASAGREDAASKVYDHIATGGFTDRYAPAERALDAQMETLRKEKQYYARSWAQREQQIDKTSANLTGMVTDLIRVWAELPSTELAELPHAELTGVAPGEPTVLPAGSVATGQREQRYEGGVGGMMRPHRICAGLGRSSPDCRPSKKRSASRSVGEQAGPSPPACARASMARNIDTVVEVAAPVILPARPGPAGRPG